MKTITITKYGEAEKAFETLETKTPSPKQGEVLIKVAAFGLNYADVMARKGMYKDAPPIPFVPGYEVVGIVESIGGNVNGISAGDRVIGFTRFGAYAEYAIADQRAVVKINNDTANGEAVALATQYCTAYFAAYEMANIKENETILIHAAAGGVGTALIQLAKLKNCKIYGTASKTEKLDYIKQQGVQHPINYVEKDFSKAIDDEVDVVFDPVGGSSFKKDKKILAKGGRIICYGGSERSKGGLFDTLKFVWNFGFYTPIELLMKSQGIIGVNMLRIADYKPEVLQRVMQNVVKLYNEGKLKPYVGAKYKASQTAEAHKFFENRNSIGKIVVEW